MTHRREPEEPRPGQRIKTWTIGAAVMAALALAVVLAVLTMWP